MWEDWGYLDALYFCFVTFSTLGFGDIVPGTTNLDSPESQAQLIVTGIWQVRSDSRQPIVILLLILTMQ